MRNIIGLLFFGIFLTGCYTSSLTMVGPATGVASGKYIFCLPGSPSACKDGWDEILRYQLDIRHKPCNFVEIMPRLQEHKFFRTKS